MTGHGNVVFNDAEIINLRNYLTSGGFLHIDDNYGMDEFIRKEIKKVISQQYTGRNSGQPPDFPEAICFSGGNPKNSRTWRANDHKSFGIFVENRLVLLYTFETDLGDGWEDPDVHNDPPEVRLKALRMGTNILNYIFI